MKLHVRHILMFMLSYALAPVAEAKPLMTKVEVLEARTEIATKENFCIQSVDPHATFSFTENSRDGKSYECAINFTGLVQGSNSPINGARVIRYFFSPYVARRNSLENEQHYFASHAPTGALTYYIPQDVFAVLDGSSKSAEETEIAKKRHDMAIQDDALARAERAACYVAFLEVFENACSPENLATAKAALLEKAARGGFINLDQIIKETK